MPEALPTDHGDPAAARRLLVNLLPGAADVSDVAPSTDSMTGVSPVGPTDQDQLVARLRPASGPAAAPSATHLLELVAASSELTFLVNGDLQVVYAGGPIGSLLGHDPAEVVGRPITELVHPSHQPPFATALSHILSGLALADATLRWPHRDGGPGFDLRVSFASLPGPGGSLQPASEGFMVRAAHQPTHDLAVGALEGRADEARTNANGLPVAVFILDGRGRCVSMSSRWTEITGQPEPASLGLGWVSAIAEDDRSGFRTAAAQAHARRTGWRQQFRVRRPDGTLAWVDGAAAPLFGPDGAVTGYVGLLADATIEIEARAELNRRTTIVESTAEYVVMDDRGPRLMYGADPAPLASTPPVPAPDAADGARPSLGALANDAQGRYLNEIRPAVLADGVWQDHQGAPAPGVHLGSLGEPAAPTTAQDAADAADDLPQPPIPQVEEIGSAVVAQPVAWDFDADAVPSADDDPQPVGWQVPAPTGGPVVAATPVDTVLAEHAATSATTDAPRGPEQVFVGLVGPSGRVETVAAVSGTILEPVVWEQVGDQLPTIDAITGLANRALFLERLRHALARMSKDGVSVALMLPTLHGYSELRQRVGRKTGDDQLFVMAKRLEATIRQTDTAARIGDEDFAILALGWFFPGDVENVAMRFLRKLSEAVPSVGEQVTVPCSMGVAVSEAGLDLHQLLRRAQRARKMAAEHGPGNVYVYKAD